MDQTTERPENCPECGREKEDYGLALCFACLTQRLAAFDAQRKYEKKYGIELGLEAGKGWRRAFVLARQREAEMKRPTYAPTPNYLPNYRGGPQMND